MQLYPRSLLIYRSTLSILVVCSLLGCGSNGGTISDSSVNTKSQSKIYLDSGNEEKGGFGKEGVTKDVFLKIDEATTKSDLDGGDDHSQRDEEHTITDNSYTQDAHKQIFPDSGPHIVTESEAAIRYENIEEEKKSCVTGEGPIPECHNEMCMSQEVVISINQRGVGFTKSCTSSGAERRCIPIIKVDDDAYITVSFESGLPRKFVEADLRRFFRVFSFSGTLPTTPFPINWEFVVQDIAVFDVFDFSDGLLKIQYIITSLSGTRNYYINNPECKTGDIEAYCFCSYRNFDARFVLNIELELENADE